MFAFNKSHGIKEVNVMHIWSIVLKVIDLYNKKTQVSEIKSQPRIST